MSTATKPWPAAITRIATDSTCEHCHQPVRDYLVRVDRKVWGWVHGTDAYNVMREVNRRLGLRAADHLISVEQFRT